MYAAQVATTGPGLQYFHPDPLTIYARRSDATFYVSVIADTSTAHVVKVRLLLHKGGVQEFGEFVETLRQLLQVEMAAKAALNQKAEPDADIDADADMDSPWSDSPG
jgi:hypothetical protein